MSLEVGDEKVLIVGKQDDPIILVARGQSVEILSAICQYLGCSSHPGKLKVVLSGPVVVE